MSTELGGTALEKVLSRKAMRLFEKYTIEEAGIPSLCLMERAAVAVAESVRKAVADEGSVLFVCGPGNNGADGIAAYRMIRGESDIRAEAVLVCGRDRLTPEAETQLTICERLGYDVSDSFPSDVSGFDCIVDGIFGIGKLRDITGDIKDVIDIINGSGSHVISIDVPSGIDTDTGRISGVAVRASDTVTMQYKKAGLMLYPGRSYAGKIKTVSVGICPDPSCDEGIYGLIERDDLPYILGARREDGNKGTFGKLLSVAGSSGIGGAAALVAESALRAGTGMVKTVTHESNRSHILSFVPESMTACYSDDAVDVLKSHISFGNAVVAGPGLGTTGQAEELVRTLLKDASVPLVLDADALNIISANKDILDRCSRTAVITPHIGEMSRLTGLSCEEIAGDRIGTALSFARDHGVICVLKDSCTVIASPDGKVYINGSGNDALATAGSGDVLAGLIGGLIAQGLEPFDAAVAGVFIHGLSGEEAARDLSRRAVIASDIPKYYHRFI